MKTFDIAESLAYRIAQGIEILADDEECEEKELFVIIGRIEKLKTLLFEAYKQKEESQ